MVNYPYDDEKEGKSEYSQSPDDKIFRQLSLAYSQVTKHQLLFFENDDVRELDCSTEHIVKCLCRLCGICVQENTLMHNGVPCRDIYPNEHFENGITNGAKWYNVPGRPAFIVPQVLLVFLQCLVNCLEIIKSNPFAHRPLHSQRKQTFLWLARAFPRLHFVSPFPFPLKLI